ncbi:zeta toxin family protein [Streptomyces sp. NPDC088341]|uniref:zeta toxin family protein n=1 Tax=Streptomyces sp. NPDC088341 TaxID=3154870 RepID=UPI00342FDBF4
MTHEGVGPAVLSGRERADVLHRVILPSAVKHAVRQQRPVVVFVAGPPGSGKTGLADLLHAVLDRRGGAVRIGSDLYKATHRLYAGLLADDVRTAGINVRPDVRSWQAAVEKYVRDHRLDAVVETALADAEEFRATAAASRRAGFRVEVAALATPEALSQLGILDRFLTDAAAGGGRYVSWENHDHCAGRLPQTLAVIEAEQLADRVTVMRRDGEVLYDNELLDGAWRRAPAADVAVVGGRTRPWTARETAVFQRDLARADRRVHRDEIPADKRLAVQRDSARAAALAEPVRRIAQARSAPPGVDYHRLSAEEHRWTFEELIVPSYLNGITAQERPVVTYVLAQPGAGKWRAANLVKRAMSGRGVTRLSGDDFKVQHPDYLQLLIDDPRGAGAAIRADYRAWIAEAEAYVRARRGDVLIEGAPGSTEEFWRSARPFARAGYRIELVVLAVREADSRQGTAHRYALVQKTGVPGRFTSRAGHDTCYRALPDVVRSAEADPAVASVLVLRRDFEALFRNERDADGRWARPARAALTLALERLRPYTVAEGVRFLSLHRKLLGALPQYRAELEEIASRARLLLPGPLGPRPISPAGTSRVLLPVPAQHRGGGYSGGYSLVSSV